MEEDQKCNYFQVNLTSADLKLCKNCNRHKDEHQNEQNPEPKSIPRKRQSLFEKSKIEKNLEEDKNLESKTTPKKSKLIEEKQNLLEKSKTSFIIEKNSELENLREYTAGRVSLIISQQKSETIENKTEKSISLLEEDYLAIRKEKNLNIGAFIDEKEQEILRNRNSFNRQEISKIVKNTLQKQINKKIPIHIENIILGKIEGPVSILLPNCAYKRNLSNEFVFRINMNYEINFQKQSSVAYILAENGNLIKNEDENNVFIDLEQKTKEKVIEMDIQTKTLISKRHKNSFIDKKSELQDPSKTLIGEFALILNYYGYDFPLLEKAFAQRYMQYKVFVKKNPQVNEFFTLLNNSTQLWVISGPGPNNLNEDYLKLIRNFYNSGGSLFLFGENEPYFTEANYILENLFDGVKLIGNKPANKIIGKFDKEQGFGLIEHPIFFGIDNLYEGITVSIIEKEKIGKFKPLIIGSDKEVISAYLNEGEKKVVVDGGYTRLFNKFDNNTERFIMNCSGWLSKIL